MPAAEIRVDYASAALHGPDALSKVDAAGIFCRQQGWQFGIQIHNSESRADIKRLARLGAPLSWHGPLCSKYFMNLAGGESSHAEQSARKTARIMHKYDPSLVVFHGFLMTDYPVRAFNRKCGFEEAMSAGARPELHHDDGRLILDYCDTDEHLERLDRVRGRCRWLGENFPDIVWCIENDFPVYGGGLLLARHMLAVDSPLCLDTSHLWTTCVLFRQDFHAEVDQLAQAGRVRCVHLHASPLAPEEPGDWQDGHQPLNTPNRMDLPRLVRRLHEAGMRHWVLEMPRASLVDLQTLAQWLA